MSNQIILKKSSVLAKVPQSGDLQYGEVALNYADGKLYFKNSSNTIQPLGIAYTKVIANTNALINQGYIANTGAGSFTITLPASPQTGNYVIIVDDGNFNTNPLYVARNGSSIVGTLADLTLDIQGVSVTLLYDGGQWNVYTQVGASGGSGSGTEGQEYNYNSFPGNIIPDTNNTYSLGNSSYKWGSVYSTNFVFGDNTTQSTASNADGTSITNSGGTITAQAGGLAGTTLKSTVVSSSLTSVGTITSGTWSGSFGAVSGANLTGLTAGNLSGTIPSTVLGNSTHYIGTTAVALNRSSANLALTGISSVILPGSVSGTVQLIPTSAVGTGTVLTIPATTGTIVTTGDSATVTNTMLAGSIANAKLLNSSVTVGTTAISLGSSSTTLAGLTSVTSTTFVGALTGNASTASTLATARAINGVNFDGSAAITVTAAAGTLTGTTLNSTVVSSSLTSVGTLTSLTVTGDITTSGGVVSAGVTSSGTIAANNGIIGTSQTTAYLYTSPTTVNIATAATTLSLGASSGTTTINNMLKINYTGSAESSLQIAGNNTKGGAGYHDFLKITNTGQTNPNKYLRLTSAGALEVLNSAYTATLLSIADNGILTIPGVASVTNSSATTNALVISTHGQLFDDGNFHIHSNSGSLWLNAVDGSDIIIGTQTNTGSSKLQTNNISLDAGYGSRAPIYGIRAWINCGYNGTTMTTRASGNLSVSRASAGVYNFTFGTAMPDRNYSVTCTAMTPAVNSDIAANISYNVTPTTTGFQITTARYGTGNTDVTELHVQVVR